MTHEESFGISHEINRIGNIYEGGLFKILIKIPLKYGWIERTRFLLFGCNQNSEHQMQHVQNDETHATFQTIIPIKKGAIYHYYFTFEANGRLQYHKKFNITGDTNLSIEECWKMSIGFDAPEWAKGAIMYHIFVDRYRKGKNTEMHILPNRKIHLSWYEKPVLGPDENGRWNIDFFGGNLKGIEETLGYIKKLGVTIIYLSPVMRSQSNHRYDTADYEEVDPYAGTNEQLRELCDVAHKKGMKIVLDAVFNHTGNDSKYFNQYGTFDTVGAWQSSDSPYYSFYKRKWTQGEKGFSYWWGEKNLPECDGNSESWREYILGKGGIIDKWFELGIDGLRLDVADELTDDFIEGIYTAVTRNKPDGLVLGEVWENPMRMNRDYISSGKSMHTVMNYLMVDALIRYYKYTDIPKLQNTLKEIFTEYPDPTIYTLMNFTSTHDISRGIEIFGCDDFSKKSRWAWNLTNDTLDWIKAHKMTDVQYKYGKKMFKSYVFALTFLPGILSIFYGDEIGMQGIGNLMNRSPYTWGCRDKDLLKFFRRMGKVRNEQEFLKTAEVRILSIDENQFVFERYDKDSKVIVFSSRTHHETEINLPEEYKDATVIAKISGCTNETLCPYGAIAFKK